MFGSRIGWDWGENPANPEFSQVQRRYQTLSFASKIRFLSILLGDSHEIAIDSNRLEIDTQGADYRTY
jgi:hypothetical protein